MSAQQEVACLLLGCLVSQVRVGRASLSQAPTRDIHAVSSWQSANELNDCVQFACVCIYLYFILFFKRFY